jgi:predicted nucleotidyltransferase
VNITALFSTDQRTRILRDVAYQTEPLNVTKEAKRLGLSKGLVSKYLKILLEEGVLQQKDGDYTVVDSTATRAIRILLNLRAFHNGFFKDRPFVKGAGLYGSTVKGTNVEGSDTDLWIITDEVSQETLAKLTSDLRKTFGDVTPLYLTIEKLDQLRKTETTFYHSLVFGSLTLIGDDLETL